MTAVRDEQRRARAIVQAWLDTNESDFPCHRALRELAVLFRLERTVTTHTRLTTPPATRETPAP